MKLDGEKISLDSTIKNNRKAFKEVKKIYHYTTQDTLYKILESKALIFNRNDKVNDILEHSRSIDAGFNYYVSCFSHNEIECKNLMTKYPHMKFDLKKSSLYGKIQ